MCVDVCPWWGWGWGWGSASLDPLCVHAHVRVRVRVFENSLATLCSDALAIVCACLCAMVHRLGRARERFACRHMLMHGPLPPSRLPPVL
jgi:hypothetical protein